MIYTKIVVYATTTCPYCKMLKDYLTSRNVVFEEKMVDQDGQAKNEMMAKSGGYLGVPFTVITKDTGEEIKVVGFDRALFDSTLAVAPNFAVK